MAGKRTPGPLEEVKFDSLEDWLKHVKRKQNKAGVGTTQAAAELMSAEQYYDMHKKNNVPFNKDVWESMYGNNSRAFDITDFGQTYNSKLSPNELMKRIQWAQVDVNDKQLFMRTTGKYGASGQEIIGHIKGHPYSFYNLGDDWAEIIAGTPEYQAKFFSKVRDAVDAGEVVYGVDSVDEAAVRGIGEGGELVDNTTSYNVVDDAMAAESANMEDWEAQDVADELGAENKKLANKWVNESKKYEVNYSDVLEDANAKAEVDRLILSGHLKKDANGMFVLNEPNIGVTNATETRIYPEVTKQTGVAGTADSAVGKVGNEVLVTTDHMGKSAEIGDWIDLKMAGEDPRLYLEDTTVPQGKIGKQFIGKNFDDLNFNDKMAIRSLYTNGTVSVLDDGSIIPYNADIPAGQSLREWNQSDTFNTLNGDTPDATKGASKLRKLTLAGLGILGGGAANAADLTLAVGDKAGLSFGESAAATGAGLGAMKYATPSVWAGAKGLATKVATPWAASDFILGTMNAENAMVRRQDPEELGVNSYMRNTGALRPEAQKAFGDMQQSYLSGGATHYNYNQFNPEQTYGPREGWATYGNKMLNEDGSGKDTLDYIKPLFWGG